MLKRIMFIFLLLSAISFSSFSFAEEQTVKVNFSLKELAFSINILNSIELRGDEVVPFMDIKNLLVDLYKKAAKDKEENVTIRFSESMARNFLFFTQRAKLKGDEASIFYNISQKVVDAVKKK